MNKKNNELETQSVIVNGMEITPRLVKELKFLSTNLELSKSILLDGVFFLAQMDDDEDFDRAFFSLMGTFRTLLESIDQKGGQSND